MVSAPPSIALALMAMRKAGYRKGVMFPIPRAEAGCGYCYPFATAYYRIIDRITRGEKP